jgi:4,5-DOPA dioxygenase extradiol
VDEELNGQEPDHEAVPADAATLVASRAATAITPGRMPAVYLGHGAPPLVDDPLWVVQLGAALQPLRDEGVLIMGSGFLTHGLPFLSDFRFNAPPPSWSAEFDQWAATALDRGDVDALAAFRGAPAVRYAHPTTEHYAPLFVALGASESPDPVTTIAGYWLGLAKRSVQVA